MSLTVEELEAQGLLDELANLFADESSAQGVLDQVGFPRDKLSAAQKNFPLTPRECEPFLGILVSSTTHGATCAWRSNAAKA
jgi:hypothetical protein